MGSMANNLNEAQNAVRNVPARNDSDTNWINWHKNMLRVIDKDNSNYLFLQAWRKREMDGSKADTSDLRNYMSKQGVNLATNLWETATDTLGSSVEGIMGVFTGLKKSISTIVIIVVVLIGLSLVLLIRKPDLLTRFIKPV